MVTSLHILAIKWVGFPGCGLATGKRIPYTFVTVTWQVLVPVRCLRRFVENNAFCIEACIYTQVGLKRKNVQINTHPAAFSALRSSFLLLQGGSLKITLIVTYVADFTTHSWSVVGRILCEMLQSKGSSCSACTLL